MDAEKIGALLHSLRVGAGHTQRQVAQALCVTEQAVSKWERGKGCPDLSLLPALAELYAVDLRALLEGRLEVSARGGNMRNLKLYYCPQCGKAQGSVEQQPQRHFQRRGENAQDGHRQKDDGQSQSHFFYDGHAFPPFMAAAATKAGSAWLLRSLMQRSR